MSFASELIFVLFMFLLGARFRKYRPTGLLSCGQWGYIGTEFDSQKFQILGLFNQHRGVHSCGMMINGDIVKGTKESKLWMDFIAQTEIPTTLNPETRVCLGHTRQASAGYGVHGEAQQHPFQIGGLIGQQNGTVNNAYELGRKYNIERNSWTVDTQLLYMLLAEHGLDILEQYDGAAALMWIEEQDPNQLFIFKGASKTQAPKDQGLYVERPLYYLREASGIYFSSMENSLQAISTSPDFELQSVPHNKVIALKINDDGEINVRIIREIERKKENFVTFQHFGGRGGNMNTLQPVTGPLRGMNTNSNNTFSNATDQTQQRGGATVRIRKANKKSEFNSRIITPDKAVGSHIVFKTGRYYCGDKLIHGVVRVNDYGKILPPQGKKVKDKNGTPLYFYAGVMFRDRDAYEMFNRTPWRTGPDSKSRLKKHRHYFRRQAFEATSKPSWVQAISEYSKFPIKVMPENCTDAAYHEKWYFKGQIADSVVFKPTFHELKHFVSKGGLIGKVVASNTDGEFVLSCGEGVNATQLFRDEFRERNPNSGQAMVDGVSIAMPTCGCEYVGDGEEEADDEPVMDAVYRDFIVQKTSIWDRVMNTVEEYFEKLEVRDITALHYLLDGEYNNKDLPIVNRMTPEEIKVIFLDTLDTAVKNRKSLRQTIDEISMIPIDGFVDMVTTSAQRGTERDRFQLIRELYGYELNNSFLDIVKRIENVPDEDEDSDYDTDDDVNVDLTSFITESLDEATELRETCILDSIENAIDCVNTLNGIEEELDTYSGDPKADKLKEIISLNNNSLHCDLKEFVDEELSKSEEEKSKILNL